jgi:hypothetical protein
VWLFFGYSSFYGRFIGVVELLAGVLCLVPRTHRLGAMAAFPLMTNVAVMDWLVRIPLPACSARVDARRVGVVGLGARVRACSKPP